MNRIAVIGCGNAARSDDGAGVRVVQLLRERGVALDARVSLFDAGTDGMAVMFAARGCDMLVVVDAALSGSEPGAVFEVPGAELEARHAPSLTLHDFRWEHALYAGRRIYGDAFPRDVTVILIEAQSTGYGLELSRPVAVGVRRVADRVQSLVRQRLLQAA